MIEAVVQLWSSWPVGLQDSVLVMFALLPGMLLGVCICWGFRPWPLAAALLWRYRWTNFVFATLMACSVAISLALLSQERGLRTASARAADPFDMIIIAPGNEINAMLAVVYLQPHLAPLLPGELLDTVQNDPDVSLAAPLAFGDSIRGAPLVGTTAAFLRYLTQGELEGRLFDSTNEAVVGARIPFGIGARVSPTHGVGETLEAETHQHVQLAVVGRLAPTQTPWDTAVFVPVETVWMAHGLGSGHADGDSHVGHPFDPARFPGVQSIVVKADSFAAYYSLRARYTDQESLAFFPGEVLARLHVLLGDVRQAMSLMAGLTQLLVAVSVFAGIIILLRLFSRRVALLRATGAPARFVFAVLWCHGAVLVIAGAVVGVVLAYGLASMLSHLLSARLDMPVASVLTQSDLLLTAAFVSAALLIACLPALLALLRPVVDDLRV